MHDWDNTMRIGAPLLPLIAVCLIAAPTQLLADGPPAPPPGLPDAFYRPAGSYTIVQSAIDSVRFTLQRCLVPCSCGGLRANSSFVDPTGRPMDWHDFGTLEGPGWAANAVGGAWEIYRLGSWLGRKEWQERALRVLDHVLKHGFVRGDGLIIPYRDLRTGKFCLNYKHNSDWLCPGSMARVAVQMIQFATDLPEGDRRKQRLLDAAVRCARWLNEKLETVPSGWYPRRCRPDGTIYRQSPTGGPDPLWDRSADGLFIVLLNVELTRLGLADYRSEVRNKVKVFIDQGGIFGSINHDTYDAHENVAYAVAFRTLLRAARLLADDSIRRFAYDRCLGGLDGFKMCEDRNGVRTRGLLFMERSWDTAYLWENAEAALAYFEAAHDVRRTRPRQAFVYELDGLTILRACALHHYGPYGFLTEGVDWNNHVGQQHHIRKARYGAIRYTEPLLNNQHIVEPTLFYLTHLARRAKCGDHTVLLDGEGNRLWPLEQPPDTDAQQK